jgi:Caspase domain
MTRRSAILIGMNDATSAPLQGVDADIRRVGNHLLSDFGGAWRRQEITYYPRPTVAKLTEILNAAVLASPDILFIYFSGHGFADGNGDPYICLRDDHYFPVSDLCFIAPRQVTIIDACRLITRGRLVEAARTATTGALAGLDARDYRASCRAMYDVRITRTDAATVVLHACSPDQTSSDYPNGGLFTHSLVSFASAAAEIASDGIQCMKQLPISRAFHGSKVRTEQRNPEQTPTLDMWDEGGDLPFAVA